MSKNREPDVSRVVFNFFNDASCVLPDGAHTKSVSDSAHVIHWHGLNYITISPKPILRAKNDGSDEFETVYGDRGNWQICVPISNIRTILLKQS